jgi:hypothetical protein
VQHRQSILVEQKSLKKEKNVSRIHFSFQNNDLSLFPVIKSQMFPFAPPRKHKAAAVEMASVKVTQSIVA